MTDRTRLHLDADLDLMVAPSAAGIRLSLLPCRDAPAHISTAVATSALLAAIDAADPDAMRAYLRETVEHADARAAEQFDYLDAVPEADSPEDVDESLAEQIDPQNIVRAGVLLALSQELTARAGNMIDGLDR